MDLFKDLNINNVYDTTYKKEEMWERLDNIEQTRPNDVMFYDSYRTYNFIEKEKNAVDSHFNNDIPITETAGVAYADEKQALNNSRKLTKKEVDVVKQERKILDIQRRVADGRTTHREYVDHVEKIKYEVDEVAEEELLNEKLKLIELQRKNDLSTTKDPISLAEIKLNAQNAKISALREYANVFPVGHVSRIKTLKKVEVAEVKAFNLKWDLKILKLPEGAEKKHEKTQRLHKKVEGISTSIFGKDSIYCHEDSVLEITINGTPLKLINRGRAFMGGSKPSYYYEDPKTGKRYLYKKAENCMGFSKPEGAIMTSVGSWLQNELDENHAIPAEKVVENGAIVGSIQEIIDVNKSVSSVDLNKWQLDTTEAIKNNRDISGYLNEMTEDRLNQILMFHSIDWLLCNYDTKGENLLIRKDNQLVSIDKEGACSHLSKEECTHMDENYTPHTDEPIYNLIFRLYRDKHINLNVNVINEMIKKVEKIDTEEFISKYRPMLQIKFKDVKKEQEMENKLRDRKNNLRKEYADFFRNKLNKPLDADKIESGE